MVWNESYTKAQKHLEPGAVVTLTGRLDLRDEGPRITAEEIKPLKKPEPAEKPLVLTVDRAKATDADLLRIRDVPSPNHEARPDGAVIDTLVLHYTGMQSGAAAVARLHGLVRSVWLAPRKPKDPIRRPPGWAARSASKSASSRVSWSSDRWSMGNIPAASPMPSVQPPVSRCAIQPEGVVMWAACAAFWGRWRIVHSQREAVSRFGHFTPNRSVSSCPSASLQIGRAHVLNSSHRT